MEEDRPRRQTEIQSEPQADPDEVEELPEFDHADPLKREDEHELPGLDPAPALPPE
jgi:hypothetical protein